MSYYWAMAGQWMASTLRSTAEAHLARAAAIRTGAQSIGALRPPVWTGRAAQTERADREAMTARMDRTTQVLEGYGRLARDTASELAAIQADRAAIVSELNALGWLMNAFGVLSRLSPTSSTGAIEAGMVADIARRAEQLDRGAAAALDSVASSYQRNQERLEALDTVNSYQLTFLEGALDGLDWHFDPNLDEVLELLPENDPFGMTREELAFLLETNRQAPALLTDFLSTGRWGPAVEHAALRAYVAMASDGVVSRGVKELLEKQYGFDLDDARFATDGTPLAPKILDSGRAIDGPQAAGSPLDTILDDMVTSYKYTSDMNPDDTNVVRVRITGDPPVFTAVIPGTTLALEDPNGWGGDPEGTDWPANVNLVGSGSSSAKESVMAAIDLAVRDYETRHGPIQGRPVVNLAGHSQGGILAANVASERFFASRYDVNAVVTVGSPIGSINVGKDTRVLSIVNEHDVVSRIDVGTSRGLNITEVTFTDSHYPQSQTEPGGDLTTHSHEPTTYRDRLLTATKADAEALRGFEASLLGAGKTDSETILVSFGRRP